MGFFSRQKNTSHLLSICEQLIDKYEAEVTAIGVSCKADLMAEVKAEAQHCSKEIAGWKDCDTDYIQIAHNLLADKAFGLLVSGKYHLYAKELNPMGPANRMRHVFRKSLEWAVEHKLLTQEEFEEQMRELHRGIRLL